MPGTQKHPALVPITPGVLKWAIDESGFTTGEIAELAQTPIDVLNSWLEGREQPPISGLRELAGRLGRPFATFLLPEPPAPLIATVEFRGSPDDTRRAELNPVERKQLREVSRIQALASWALRELGSDKVSIPQVRTKTSADEAAAAARNVLGIQFDTQSSWTSGAQAFHAWRRAVERLGVLVLVLPLGADSCRGFSIWDDYAPVVVVNSWWNHEARAFTLLHEFGHLLTRTNSVCVEPVQRKTAIADPTERWCEKFAAAVLLPWQEVREVLKRGKNPQGMAAITLVARRMKVSLRATAIRLIEKDLATWTLYARVLPKSDFKRRGGGSSGEGRDRTQIKLDQIGKRTIQVLSKALERDVLGRADVIDYIDLPASALDQLGPDTGDSAY